MNDHRPETTRAILPCDHCGRWVPHVYVRNRDVTSAGEKPCFIKVEQWFACAAGHERIWGCVNP